MSKDAGVATVFQADATERQWRKPLRQLLLRSGSIRTFGSGRTPGLFASPTTSNRRLLEELTQHGLIDLQLADDGAERAVLTPTGRQWLLDHEYPAELLEDLLRELENQSSQFAAVRQTLDRLIDRQSGLCRITRGLLGAAAGLSTSTLDLLAPLQRWSSRAGAVTLAELYYAVHEDEPNLTIGAFHDAVRQAAAQQNIVLTPWTGPLYDIPEPQFALLIGHEVLYYVRLA